MTQPDLPGPVVEALPVYVLDSYALLAYFQAEPGGSAVRALLEGARDQTATLTLSLMNAGERYYIMHRQQGSERAEAMLDDLRALPITFAPATEERIFAAARLKAEHAMSYADAFAAGLAMELGATLVTGDPEFRSVEARLAVMWLPDK